MKAKYWILMTLMIAGPFGCAEMQTITLHRVEADGIPTNFQETSGEVEQPEDPTEPSAVIPVPTPPIELDVANGATTVPSPTTALTPTPTPTPSPEAATTGPNEPTYTITGAANEYAAPLPPPPLEMTPAPFYQAEWQPHEEENGYTISGTKTEIAVAYHAD